MLRVSVAANVAASATCCPHFLPLSPPVLPGTRRFTVAPRTEKFYVPPRTERFTVMARTGKFYVLPRTGLFTVRPRTGQLGVLPGARRFTDAPTTGQLSVLPRTRARRLHALQALDKAACCHAQDREVGNGRGRAHCQSCSPLIGGLGGRKALNPKKVAFGWLWQPHGVGCFQLA